MAITANTVYEFRTTGDDLNGGGYDGTIASAGTDWSQQDAAQYSYTLAATSGAGAVVLAADAAADMVGNIIRIASGTNFTAGFYQIISVVAGVSFTTDRNCATGVGASGNIKIGGARKLLSSNSFAAALVAGNTVWVKSGSYTMGTNFSSATNGTAAAPMNLLGYDSSRGDNPTGANRPTLACGTNTFATGNFWIMRNFIMTGSSTNGLNTGSQNDCTLINIKSTNTSASSLSAAIRLGQQVRVIDCEMINANGIGATIANTNSYIFGCYIHGSLEGIHLNSNISGAVILSTIIAGCASGIVMAGGNLIEYISNNTIFGAETPSGTGILSTAGNAIKQSIFLNNIIYGFTTGVNLGSSQPSNYWDYNDFYNNTTARTNVTAGDHDVAIDPGFTNTAGADFSITGAI